MSKTLKKRYKRFRRWIIGLLVRAVAWTLSRFPFPFTFWLLETCARMAYPLLGRRKQRMLANLHVAFGEEKTDSELESIAREAVINYGRSVAEMVYLRWPDRLFPYVEIEIEGEENFKEAVRQGKGVICATAHFGNWELMAARMCRLGYKVNVIARPMRDAGFDNWLNETRRRAGSKVILRGKMDLELFRCLRRNEALGILCDLDTKGSGVFVEFFGRPAYTQTGPVVLSLRTGARIIVSLVHREGPRRHRIVIFPALQFQNSDSSEEAKVHACLRQLNAVLESEIRKYPTEWAWMHRRWRSKPE